MPNGMYGGVRGRKTKVGRKLLLFSSYSISTKVYYFVDSSILNALLKLVISKIQRPNNPTTI